MEEMIEREKKDVKENKNKDVNGSLIVQVQVSNTSWTHVQYTEMER